MTDIDQPERDDATPPATPASPVSLGKESRFTLKRLLITFVAVLLGTVGGTWFAHTLTSNNSSGVDHMNNWMMNYGSHYLGVSSDTVNVSSATTPKSLHAACVKLQDDVTQAQADPAMPLNSLQQQWSVILSNLSTAGSDCILGIETQSADLLQKGQSHMQSASAAYLDLLKAVKQAGG